MARMQRGLADLTEAAFAPFGTVTPLAPGAAALRLVAEIENARPAARLEVDFTTVPALALPHSATLLECHRANSQSFIPLRVARYLVVVTPAGDQPDLTQARAFAARGDQAITYRAGIWHHPLAALDAPGFFAILTFRAGDADDTTLFPLAMPLMLHAGTR